MRFYSICSWVVQSLVCFEEYSTPRSLLIWAILSIPNRQSIAKVARDQKHWPLARQKPKRSHCFKRQKHQRPSRYGCHSPDSNSINSSLGWVRVGMYRGWIVLYTDMHGEWMYVYIYIHYYTHNMETDNIYIYIIWYIMILFPVVPSFRPLQRKICVAC